MMTRTARWLTGTAALLLVAAFAFPLWHIRLIAPQYPEGLGLLIHVNTIRGGSPTDLANINGLNHYIGMKAIDPSAIPVLHVMPWVLGALAVTGLVVALAGRRRLLVAWLGGFLVMSLAGLAEFWLWSYDYGHNLDAEHAIIKVPGMTYQPPLIGSKQLLNFTAISWPATGGILVGIACLLGVGAVVLSMRAARAARTPSGGGAALAFAAGVAACTPSGPVPIAYDHDACDYCRMQISDPRYGAELITRTGKVLKFDSIECLASLYSGLADRSTVRSTWVSDYQHPGTLIPAAEARYVHHGGPGSPMGRGLLAVAPDADADALAARLSGETLSWADVVALVERDVPRPGATDAGDRELAHSNGDSHAHVR